MMFGWFEKLPIRHKVTGVVLLVTAFVLCLAWAVLFIFQSYQIRSEFTRSMSTLAEVMAVNSVTPLVFKDENVAQEILSSVTAQPGVIGAGIVLENGEPLLVSGKAGKFEGRYGELRLDGQVYLQGELYIVKPIRFEGSVIGRFFIRTNPRQQDWKLLRVHGVVLACVMTGCLAAGITLSTRLQRLVTDRILKLAETATSIWAGSDYSIRAEVSGKDEIGMLTRAFNGMLERIEGQDFALKKAGDQLFTQLRDLEREVYERKLAEQERNRVQRELVETSRRAGMAEVATSVLHNVGNVLNSVNVAAHLVSETVEKSRLPNLSKATAMLTQHTDDLTSFLTSNPKGRQLPGYLAQLTNHLLGEREMLLHEVSSLIKKIEHVKEVVAMQQSYARTCGIYEPLSLQQVVEDAIHLNAASIACHEVEVVREYHPDLPEFPIDKHKVVQILVNLIRNAKHAIDANPTGRKQITVRITWPVPERACVSVIDTGCGIPYQNISKIFNHGFTTKKEGHGFGLHMSALAAREMGGALHAESDGLGRGACFTLELPLLPPQSHHENQQN